MERFKELRKVGVSLCTAIVLFLLPACGVCADEGGYTVKNYEIEAVLHSDNTVDVTEQIEVFFTEERHGIYRDIPTEIRVRRDVSEQQDGSEPTMFEYKNQIKNVEVDGGNIKERCMAMSRAFE
ncbi:MAG: DUF2207 domain-containing protein [Lachnospiraceae bacterium]|nr:DUF2207 domain-containing protein [Lachnospiraceae bacterium]